MWRFLCLALAGLALAGSGCARPASSSPTDARSSPNQRIAELVNGSFESGPPGYIPEGRRREDKPEHLTPERVHGGVGQ
jgi:hypothetical protein